MEEFTRFLDGTDGEETMTGSTEVTDGVKTMESEMKDIPLLLLTPTVKALYQQNVGFLKTRENLIKQTLIRGQYTRPGTASIKFIL
jgi:hypothetical protein